ncbi:MULTISPECIES: hypothetical protein [unclassified Sphingomonas]|nr:MULTISPECIES: hypothetical protein [unclassified Sphingomonas]
MKHYDYAQIGMVVMLEGRKNLIESGIDMRRRSRSAQRGSAKREDDNFD